eukprot:jgi/Bigna1/77145/fgenesh1_pg.46_\
MASVRAARPRTLSMAWLCIFVLTGAAILLRNDPLPSPLLKSGLGMPSWTSSLQEKDILTLRGMIDAGRLHVDELSNPTKESLKASLKKESDITLDVFLPLLVNRAWLAYRESSSSRSASAAAASDPRGKLTIEDIDRFQRFRILDDDGIKPPEATRSPLTATQNHNNDASGPIKTAAGGGRAQVGAPGYPFKDEEEEKRRAEKERLLQENLQRIRREKKAEYARLGYGDVHLEQGDGYYSAATGGMMKDEDGTIGEEMLMGVNDAKEEEEEEEQGGGGGWRDSPKKQHHRRKKRGEDTDDQAAQSVPHRGLRHPPLGNTSFLAKGGRQFTCTWPGCEEREPFDCAEELIVHYNEHSLADMGDPDNAKERKIVSRSDRKDPEDLTAVWLKEAEIAALASGNVRFREGKFVEAEKLYSQAISQAPDQHVYYVNRANARYKLQNFTGSLEDAKFAVKLCRTYGKAHYRMGEALMALGNYRLAAQAYTYGASCEAGEEGHRNSGKSNSWDSKARLAAKYAADEEKKQEREAQEIAKNKNRVLMKDNIVVHRKQAYMGYDEEDEAFRVKDSGEWIRESEHQMEELQAKFDATLQSESWDTAERTGVSMFGRYCMRIGKERGGGERREMP